MKNKEDLKKELIKIDHKSYGMYKTLGGSYSFGNYILYIEKNITRKSIAA